MAPSPLIPREVLFGNPDRASAQLSPDGSHVAYLTPFDGVQTHPMAVSHKFPEEIVVVLNNRDPRGSAPAWRGRWIGEWLGHPRGTDCHLVSWVLQWYRSWNVRRQCLSEWSVR